VLKSLGEWRGKYSSFAWKEEAATEFKFIFFRPTLFVAFEFSVQQYPLNVHCITLYCHRPKQQHNSFAVTARWPINAHALQVRRCILMTPALGE
jgi:hypothetical protein